MHFRSFAFALALFFSACAHAPRTSDTFPEPSPAPNFGSQPETTLIDGIPNEAIRPAPGTDRKNPTRKIATTEDALSPPDDDLPLRLAGSAFDQDGILACSYSAMMISYLDTIPDQTMIESLREELREYREFVNATASTAPRKTKRVQRKVLRDLELLLAHNDPKSVVRNTLEGPCKIALAVGGALVRTTGLIGSTATSAITLPVRFVAKFGIGAFTRTRTPNQGPSWSQFSAKSGGVGRLPGVAYQIARAFLGIGSTFSLSRVIAFAIDTEAARVCRDLNSRNPHEVRFCENYRKLKIGEFKATEVGEKFGISVGTLALHTFDFRRDDRVNPRICEKSVRQQYRIARRANVRLEKRLRDRGFRGFSIETAGPEIEGCVSLRVVTESETDSEEISFESNGIIDGVAYSVVVRNELPVRPPIASLDPVTDEEVCGYVHRTQVYQQDQRRMLHDLRSKTIQYAINPERFAPLVLSKVEMDDERLKKQPLAQVGLGRNVLIVMAPTDEQREEFAEIQATYEGLVKKLKRSKKKLRKLARSKDYASCLERIGEIGFDFSEFRDLTDSVNAITVAKRIEDFKLTQKEAKRAGKRVYFLRFLKREWEFREIQTLNQVREILTSPDVANVILLGHAEKNGKVLDTRNNELPIDALEWISPSVLSLSFFSCYSETAVANFRIAEMLKVQDSFHKLRYVGHVGASDFLEERKEAPLLGLSNFIEVIDRELTNVLTGSERVQTLARARLTAYEPVPTCEARVRGANLSTAGSFGLQVNSHWVGSIYPESPRELNFKFPCSWLKSSGNSASLTNQNLIEASRLGSEQVELEIDGRSVPRDEVIRSLEDQSIRKIGFHW